MARDLFNRYIFGSWIQYAAMGAYRAQIDDCWRRSHLSDGRALPRRTFYNYRRAEEELFNNEIKCDSKTFEYYIDDSDDGKTASV